MKLPTSKKGIKTNIHEYNTLIYGAPKIGKSTFCAQIPDLLFLACEPGLNAQNVYQATIKTWKELWEAYYQLEGGNHNFKAVAIDTVDIAYELCVKDACSKLRIEHESDLDFGKAYKIINKEYHRLITAFGNLPYGLFMISHATEKKLDRKKGGHTVIVPSLPTKAAGITCDFADFILFFDSRNGITDNPEKGDEFQRVIHTRATRFYTAGSRLCGLPSEIPLDYKSFEVACDKAIHAEAEKNKPMPPTQEETRGIIEGIRQLSNPNGDLEGDALTIAMDKTISAMTKENVKSVHTIASQKVARRVLELINEAMPTTEEPREDDKAQQATIDKELEADAKSKGLQ